MMMMIFTCLMSNMCIKWQRNAFVDCNSNLEPLKLTKAPLQILLSKIIAMEEVKHALELDIEKLENEVENLQGCVRGVATHNKQD